MLRLDTVEAAYGPSRVLHGVTLEAREGEVVSLLGRNGAGKSTTLKAIVGMVAVTGGAITLDDRPLQTLLPHEISRLGVGWVPEDRRIFSDLTVAENLLVGAKGDGGWSVERVYQYFPKLGQLAGRRGGSLSGGEQQMLTMAPLIVRPPAVLVADEPTLGLAPLVVEQLIEIFADLRDEGVTLLLVEEKVRDVLKIADHVTFLELGHVVWSGSRADVADERLAAAYLGAAPVVDA